jgi:hypothetical protein
VQVCVLVLVLVLVLVRAPARSSAARPAIYERLFGLASVNYWVQFP